MPRLTLLAALALVLCGCSTTKADKPPVCDGSHRRPANLYGSVLSPAAPTPATTTSPSSEVPAASEPAAKPKPVSALSVSQGNCA